MALLHDFVLLNKNEFSYEDVIDPNENVHLILRDIVGYEKIIRVV